MSNLNKSNVNTSINDLFKQYLECIDIKNFQSNGQLSQLSITADKEAIFNQFTKCIVDQDFKNIGELLQLMNKCSELKTNMNTTDKITEAKGNLLDSFFNEYSMYLSLNTNTKVLIVLLEIIRKLSNQSKLSLTKFIWSYQGFRNLIKYYPLSSDGYNVISTSILCSVTMKDKLMSNLDIILEKYIDLINDLSISDDLIKYINHIFVLNNAYSFDDPRMMNPNALSSSDFLVLSMNLLIEHMKVMEKNNISFTKNTHEAFWRMVNIVYVTLYVMYYSVLDSFKTYSQQLSECDAKNDQNNIKNLKSIIRKGKKMLKNLTTFMSTIDTKYVDNKICELIDNLIIMKDYKIMTRLIDCFGNRPSKNILVDKSKLARMILKILSSESVPAINKFSSMRFIMSHNLKEQIFLLEESSDIITKYILNDVQKLQDLDKFHLIDMMVELSDTCIMFSQDIMELYMFMIPDFSEHYSNILKQFLYLSNKVKPDAINDLGNMITFSEILIKNMLTLGRVSLSYLNDIFTLIETICDTKNILATSVNDNVNFNDLNYETKEDFENGLKIFDELESKYVTIIKPNILSLFKTLAKDYKVIINKNSDNILKKYLKLDLELELNDEYNNNQIKVMSFEEFPSDTIDVIKCDIAINPYYIKTGENTFNLMDRKTIYNLFRTKIHPFTRELIDKNSIETFNETEEVQLLRTEIISKINQL